MNPGQLLRRSCVLLLVAVLSAGLLSAPASAASKRDPRLSRAFFVDNQSPAYKAAKADRRFAPIGNRAQALWLTEHLSVGKVKKATSTYAKRANKKKRTPIFAIYAIPGRDCGYYSAGGFDPSTYKRWVTQIAAGLKGRKAIVVLEPDALALQGNAQCAATEGDRLGLMKFAARKLKSAGVWVYIDAGHNTWQPADVVATRLVAAGVAQYARGFSLNVASYQHTEDERAYGNRIVAELNKRGAKGKRFVIDTSRNGAATPPSNGDFCNPIGQRLGKSSERPRMVRKGYLDAYVWIKRPGESDGPCNGGPNAGVWWPEGALRLLGKA